MVDRVETRRSQVHQRLDRRFSAEGMDSRAHGVFLSPTLATCKHGLAPRVAVPQKSEVPGCRHQGGNRVTDPVLQAYRESIDNIDAALVFMLAERFKITQAVGRYKAETSLPPADPGRETEQIARLRALAVSANLDPEFSEKFLRFVIDEVIRHHQAARG